MNDSDESLLLRWSRRKAAARQGKPEPLPAPAETKAAPEPSEGQATGEAPSETATLRSTGEEKQQAAPAVALEDLPDLETLTYESDFSAFLREGVPELIKRQALRKLWASNPILANLDGLNDYDPQTMTFLQQLEGEVEPIAEIGRGLRDKIMEAKRARDNRPRGPRRPRSEEIRQPVRAVTERQPEAEDAAEIALTTPKSSDA
jgi:Protein of unknown function (DUF3306)